MRLALGPEEPRHHMRLEMYLHRMERERAPQGVDTYGNLWHFSKESKIDSEPACPGTDDANVNTLIPYLELKNPTSPRPQFLATLLRPPLTSNIQPS